MLQVCLSNATVQNLGTTNELAHIKNGNFIFMAGACQSMVTYQIFSYFEFVQTFVL